MLVSIYRLTYGILKHLTLSFYTLDMRGKTHQTRISSSNVSHNFVFMLFIVTATKNLYICNYIYQRMLLTIKATNRHRGRSRIVKKKVGGMVHSDIRLNIRPGLWIGGMVRGDIRLNIRPGLWIGGMVRGDIRLNIRPGLWIGGMVRGDIRLT